MAWRGAAFVPPDWVGVPRVPASLPSCRSVCTHYIFPGLTEYASECICMYLPVCGWPSLQRVRAVGGVQVHPAGVSHDGEDCDAGWRSDGIAGPCALIFGTCSAAIPACTLRTRADTCVCFVVVVAWQLQSTTQPIYELVANMTSTTLSTALVSLNTVSDRRVVMVTSQTAELCPCRVLDIEQTLTNTIDFPSLHTELACTLTRIDQFPDINAIAVGGTRAVPV